MMRSFWFKIPSWGRKIIQYVLVTVFWLGLWWIAARRVGEPLLLPSPWAVIRRLGELASDVAFWRVIGTSLWRILIGMLAAILAGCILAVATHFIPPLYTLFFPLITVMRATPVVSIIILAFLWIGRDDIPSFISALMVLPVVWANLHEALGATDPQLKEMARAFRFSPAKKIKRIYLPAVVPAFTASCRSSIGLAWKAGVAAEVLTVPLLSIGRMLSDAKLYLETTDLFAWTLAVVLLSLLLELLVTAILKLIWRRRKDPMRGVTKAVSA